LSDLESLSKIFNDT